METKTFNPKLRAAMFIKNLVEALKKNWNQMHEIDDGFTDVIENATALLEANTTKESLIKWKSDPEEIKNNISTVNRIFSSAVEKINKKDVSGLPVVWKNFEEHLRQIENGCKTLDEAGKNILPPDQQNNWNDLMEIAHSYLPLIRMHADICNFQLRMIEKYSKEELDLLTKIIMSHIPHEFNIADADKYSFDYIDAYEKIKMESMKKKNLWDKFLDVLAGSTYQSPAERVMMERWIEGEKGEL